MKSETQKKLDMDSVDLPVYGANKTFCGLYDLCKICSHYRLLDSHEIERLVTKIPTIFAGVITLFLIRREQTERYVKENKGIKEQEGFCGSKKLAGWKFVVLFYGKLIWDVIDVNLDSYLSYQLKFGTIIDENITRNSHVTDAIYAFAILGAIKTCALFFLIKEGKLHSELLFL